MADALSYIDAVYPSFGNGGTLRMVLQRNHPKVCVLAATHWCRQYRELPMDASIWGCLNFEVFKIKQTPTEAAMFPESSTLLWSV